MDYELFTLHHHSMDCFGVRLSREDTRNGLIRKINGIKWSRTHRCWYGESSKEFTCSLEHIFGHLSVAKETSNPDLDTVVPDSAPETALPESTNALIEKMADFMRSQRYSESSVKVYVGAIQVFLRYFKDRSPATITAEDVILFNNGYLLEKNLSVTYQSQMVSAIKMFYKVTENRVMDIVKVHRPRPEHRLPNVLSKEEMKALLEALGNMKHRAMLALTYACGLRRGEVLALKPADIDSKRNIITIRQSKGKKDRIVPMGQKILELLREYYKAYRPLEWLFEGQTPGKPYGERSFQMIIKAAARKAGIKKPVTLHWLRHSYATHLHEDGFDILLLSKLLGHKNTKTTEIYTHVSTRSIQNIKSPFENL